MHIKPYENLPVKFESGGYIDTNYRGRITVKLVNYASKKIKFSEVSYSVTGTSLS